MDSHYLWIRFIGLTSPPDALIIIKRKERHFTNESVTSFPFGNKSPSPNKHKGIFFLHLDDLPGGLWGQEQGLHLSAISTHWGPANNIFPQERTGDRGTESDIINCTFWDQEFKGHSRNLGKSHFLPLLLSPLRITQPEVPITESHHFPAFKYPVFWTKPLILSLSPPLI